MAGRGKAAGMTMADVRQRPTRRQLETLCAYLDAGSIKAAASQLGITESTTRQNLSALYRRTGSLNAAQAAFVLGRGAFGTVRGGRESVPLCAVHGSNRC